MNAMKTMMLLGLIAVVAANTGKAGKAKKPVDENALTLTDRGQKVVWAVFFGMAVPAAYFAYQALNAPASSNKKYRIYTTFICTIASLAYLAMATGHGIYTREFDGRELFYARYIDWTFTTPLMLMDILGMAGATSDTVNLLVGADVLMIIAGLIGALLEGQEKWYFWGFGMIMFMPILYYLNALKGPSGTTLNKISLLTIVGWSAYPIVWVVAGGQGTITGDQEAMAYTVLDFLCNTVFGFLIISARDAAATPLP
jgi:bacteriorhodopsin